MSIKAVHWALFLPLPPVPKIILIALADNADDDGVCWPGLELVAVKASVNRRTVMRNLAELETAGFLSIETRVHPGTGITLSNLYRLRLTRTDDVPRVGGQRAQVGASGQPGGRSAQVGAAVSPLKPSEDLSGLEQSESEEPSGNENIAHTRARVHEDDPAWLKVLHEIPVWSCDHDTATIANIAEDGISDVDALVAATAFVGKWDGKKYKRAHVAFRNWALGEKRRTKERNGKPQNGLSPIEAGRAGAFADSSRYEV